MNRVPHCFSWAGFFIIFLTSWCLKRGQANTNPTNPFSIPLLHTEQTPASALPFQQFSPSEQKRQLEALTKLDQAARTVVGVFPPYLRHSLSVSSHNPNNYYDTHISGSVVVTIANMSNLNHLRNFACFAKRIQMHFLVLAVDDSLVNAMAESKHDYFSVLRYHGYYTATTTNSSKTETAEAPLANTAGFQSKQLNLISLRKFEAVYDLQRLGYDVLFVDIDVIILQDVFPMLLQPALQEISYLHSMNQPCSESGYAHMSLSIYDNTIGCLLTYFPL